MADLTLRAHGGLPFGVPTRVPASSPTLASSAAPAPRGAAASRSLLIASVPSNHVYVRHIASEGGGGPVRLPDPVPAGEPAATQRWWPPVMLDPAWVSTHDFDVYHLHFGFDARTVEELQDLVSALRRTRRPLVLTVHDLRNPHHDSRELHDRQLDVLVPAADEVITLTTGASDEIRGRWGREAWVLPHPHVVPFSTMRAAQAMRSVHRRGARGRTFRIGLHVKSLRAGMHPHPLVPALVEAVKQLPGAVLQVNGHRDVLEPGGARYDRDLATMLRRHAGQGSIHLRVHDYFTDSQLWGYLASLDVSVLPYRFGTHSGWLEACRDLGTEVVAPTCGYFADQGPVLTYRHDETTFDPESLVSALTRAYHGGGARGTDVEERRHQRAHVAARHDLVYASALGSRP